MVAGEQRLSVCLLLSSLHFTTSTAALQNIALGLPSAQSGEQFPSSLAVDGDNSTFQASSCATTTLQEIPWWYVDLGEIQTVFSVKIVAFSPCDAMVSKVRVFVTDEATIPSEDLSSLGKDCQPAGARLDQVKVIPCNKTGRFVMLTRAKLYPPFNAKRRLCLCEVEVFGYGLSTSASVTLPNSSGLKEIKNSTLLPDQMKSFDFGSSAPIYPTASRIDNLSTMRKSFIGSVETVTHLPLSSYTVGVKSTDTSAFYTDTLLPSNYDSYEPQILPSFSRSITFSHSKALSTESIFSTPISTLSSPPKDKGSVFDDRTNSSLLESSNVLSAPTEPLPASAWTVSYFQFTSEDNDISSQLQVLPTVCASCDLSLSQGIGEMATSSLYPSNDLLVPVDNDIASLPFVSDNGATAYSVKLQADDILTVSGLSMQATVSVITELNDNVSTLALHVTTLRTVQQNTSVTPKPCGCNCYKIATQGTMSRSLMSEILFNLSLSKANLSSTRRRLRSASDDRITCQAVGYVSILMVTSMLIFTVLGDIRYVGKRFWRISS